MNKTAQCQLDADKAYKAKALERTSPLVISEHEQDVYDALQALREYYGDNRAKAMKQAILAHAKQLNLV